MSQQIRRTAANVREKQGIGPGPYLARIVGHLDTTYMGVLKVRLLMDKGNTPGKDDRTYNVKATFPFFGYTGYEYMGVNDASSSTLDAFNDTQKSYGMWFVPPDIGVVVMVIFIDGDPAQGYWIGCVPSNFTNHMVPAIGASKKVDMSRDDKIKFDTAQPLPVAEINRRKNAKGDTEIEIDPEMIKKPLHPIAEKFLEQGLVEDEIRGSTTTTSRRNLPSSVYGMLTPGPRDKRPNAKKGVVGSSDSQTTSYISRLGGTQFVMDDGDERFERKGPAGKLPFKDAYASLLAGGKGNPEIPFNEYFRVRTRTGHQILMHNSEDLIYIGNSRGTTWIELTSNGKIDIYAQDSISIHTENDLNVRADRDINMEAGRNINLKTGAIEKTGDGRLQMDVTKDWIVTVGNNGLITTKGNVDIKTTGNVKIGTEGNVDIKTTGNVKMGTDGNLDINTAGGNKFTAGANTDIKSAGNHIETASAIHMNGPSAATASAAELAAPAEPLETRKNISTDPAAGWKVRYQLAPVDSIMKRIPMHEPWLNHENLKPDITTPKDTDREKSNG
jgi:uncharacterized protein (DUF2345 family)